MSKHDESANQSSECHAKNKAKRLTKKQDAEHPPFGMPWVAKPTTAHNNMIVLASDLSYFVVRYVRSMTMWRKTKSYEEYVARRTALRTAIREANQLIADLQRELQELPKP